MSIVVSKSDRLIKIFIDRSMSKDDIETFFDATEDGKSDFEISFMNIFVILSSIIKRLRKIKKSTSITTNETTLLNYLQSLNFDIRGINCYINKNHNSNINYIGIGGSAGSLEKISNIIKSLPASDLTIFIAVHHSDQKKSVLHDVLQNCTSKYSVIEAVSDTKVMPKTIYTAPPGKHMIVSGDYIFLVDGPKINFSKPSISTLFNSLAKEYGSDLLCLLVCGYGRDGSDSLQSLKNSGATILIQDSEECDAAPMLDNAVKTGFYDYILPLEKINKYIFNSITGTNQIKEQADKEMDHFLDEIYNIYGYDYRNYQKEHILRRINHFCNIMNMDNFFIFKESVLQNRSIFEKLFVHFSINVTTLFRNPEVYKTLRKNLIPKLDSFHDIKIWCAGCSTGEEPYSIAILLHELGLLDRSIIYATDINSTVLKKAKNGLYSKESFDMFRKHYYQSGGEESFGSYFNINDDFVDIKDFIKEKILFFEHNLVTDSIINRFQLILCRNVFIYFDEELKNKTLDLFNDSLENYGFLVLGSSEMMHKKNFNYKPYDNKTKIYQKAV